MENENCMKQVVITGNAAERGYGRLPENVLSKVGRLRELASNTSGIRAAVMTDAGSLHIKAKTGPIPAYTHLSIMGSSSFDIYCDNVFLENARPEAGSNEIDNTIQLPDKGKMKTIHIYFPLYNSVTSFFIETEKGALNKKPEKSIKPIVFYGSSITQGACASRPGNSYVNMVSRMSGRPVINLGFSGNARGDMEIADYISKLDMFAFVYDYDHNAADTEWIENTHAPFFQAIRSIQPELPIVMMSRPGYEKWGSVAKMNRAVVMTTYLNAFTNGNNNVYFIDGKTLFGTQDREACTHDGTHPNDIGFLKMAKSVMLTIKEIEEVSNETEN